MRLWNDYEGLTVDGTFPVDKLLRPEGRSAFFTTRNGSGSPAVLRLIESIHDDDEILERWQAVSALNQPNIVAFKKFGQTTLHDEPMLYAVFEPTDISLEDILRERSLTLDETRDLAISLVTALQALHGAGLVHEHIEPANVLATADTIKLRGDCIRPIPEHLPPTEAHAPVARDIHDLSLLLLRALTHHRDLTELDRNYRLPAPFDQVIPNGVSGVWSLEQIAASLAPAPTPAVVPAKNLAATPVAAASSAFVVTSASESAPVAQPAAAVNAPIRPAAYQAPSSTPKRRPADTPTAVTDYSPAAVAAAIPVAPEPLVEDNSNDNSPVADMMKSKPFWLATGAAAIILLTLLWHGHPSSGTATAEKPGTTVAASPAASKPSAAITQSHVPVKPSAPAPSNHPVPSASASSASASGTLQWRVVAYTYNRQDQAQHKADTIAQDHRDLHPEVFTPTGRAPFLVTLGGPMTRDKAMALRDKARTDGLPKDIYAQNYTH